MYICCACGCCTKPKESRYTHLIYRTVPNPVVGGTRQEISRELPVCKSCKTHLDNGVAISDLMVIQPSSVTARETIKKVEVPDWVKEADVQRLTKKETV